MLYEKIGSLSVHASKVSIPISCLCVTQMDGILYIQQIQGDSGGICNNLGNDSMCDSKKKSSYEHGSDFGRLGSYDRLKLRIKGNDY